MVTQIVRTLRPVAAGEVGRAADDDKAEWTRERHRDHVCGDELAEPDTGIEPLGREVDQLLAGGDLHLHLGIGLAEGGDQRLQQDRHDRAGYRKTEQSRRPLSELARDFAGRNKLLEGGLGARKEALAGFGKADASRGADEEGGADARLQRADRLADRRRRHAEFAGRAAKAPMLPPSSASR